MDMYEFRLTVSWEGGGDQLFIINVEAGNEEDAKDQIQYLVGNKLEVLALRRCKRSDTIFSRKQTGSAGFNTNKGRVK